MNAAEFSIPRWRLLIIVGVVLIAMAILLTRLWEVQVGQGQVYANKLRDQTTVSVRLSPARGAIVDRNGIPLAENRASFDIDFYLDELVRHHRRQHRGKVPETLVPRRVRGKMLPTKEPDIFQIVKQGAQELSQTLGIEVELNAKDLQDHFYQTPNIPYQVSTNVDFATLARFSEHSQSVQGIEIAARPVRFYNYGALAPHIIGYVGVPTDKERTAPDGHEYESVGQAGVERVLDGKLQGDPGGLIRRVNYRGYIVGEEAYNPPSVGNSVYLTLDARIQYIVEEVMRTVGRGSAVVMDPNNGDILAMCSVPSFDPNAFIPKISTEQWNLWNKDETAPLLNRAVQTYSPGSTFKILVGLAGLKTGAFTAKTVIDCPPGIDIGGHYFKDHSGLQPNGYGPATLADAIRVSCNVYFYQAGIRAGPQAIGDLGRLLGFGESTGIPIPAEQAGNMPGPEWVKKNRPKERWTQAQTANLSIGQGFLLVTPLQMAVLASTVANGGTVYYPRLTMGVTTLGGETTVSVPTRVRDELGMRMEDIAVVREAMADCVRNGTGRRAAVEGIEVAAKTGSAQASRKLDGRLVKDTRAWMIGFAPYQQPRYAFSICVEGGVAGGVTAGPIAHEILSRIFAMERTGVSPAMEYLTPAVGHFRGVSEIVAADAAATGGNNAPGSPDNVPVTPNLVNENAEATSPPANTTRSTRSRAYSR
jgi:penicillin-binding protein 2